MGDNSWLLILSTIVWPITLLILLIVFKKEVVITFKKFSKNIDDLDNQNSKVKIDDIINNDNLNISNLSDISYDLEYLNSTIKTNNQLKGLHPICLYILIELGLGTISSSNWIKFKKYIIILNDKGLIYINSDIDILYTNEFIHSNKIELRLTKKGNLFLDRIGFRDS